MGTQEERNCVALDLLFIYLFQQAGSDPCHVPEPW